VDKANPHVQNSPNSASNNKSSKKRKKEKKKKDMPPRGVTVVPNWGF
jgi:hypothetical protein